jgi:hypothetical protein
MICRGPGFLAVVLLGSSPTPYPPFSRQKLVSLSQSSCVSPVELTDGRGGEPGAKIIPPRESLVFYKSFNTLCCKPTTSPLRL